MREYVVARNFRAIALWGKDGFARPNADITTAPFTAKQAIEIWEGLIGLYSHSFNAPQRFLGKTDIWFACKAAAKGTPMNVSFDVFLTPE